MTEGGKAPAMRRFRLAVADAWGNELLGTREEVVEREEFGADEEREVGSTGLSEEIVEYAHRRIDEIALVAGEDRDGAFGFWDPTEYVVVTEVAANPCDVPTTSP